MQTPMIAMQSPQPNAAELGHLKAMLAGAVQSAFECGELVLENFGHWQISALPVDVDGPDQCFVQTKNLSTCKRILMHYAVRYDGRVVEVNDVMLGQLVLVRPHKASVTYFRANREPRYDQ